MFRREPFPVKKIFLWFMVFLLGLVVAFIIFVSILSIKFGLSRLNQEGFFIPILAGGGSIVLSLFFFICLIRFIINLVREKDIIRSS
jgi:uncharacterized BrkB/YihY/UPF0761 family membrane protein